jgi:predicted acyltransferase
MTAPALEPAQAAAAPNARVSSVRLASLDAYRGLVMFLMAAEVLSFSRVAQARPDSALWRFLAHHQTHAEWVGCSLHDLIQPSFSFLVGAALPFSLASRAARGQARPAMTLHAAWRALVLILLGVFLRSIGQPQTYWTFEDTLTQIGLGYLPLFLLAFRPARDRWVVFGVILVGYWAAFALYPLPGPDFDYAKMGVPADWPHLMTGFAAHWNKNSNLAWACDTWFMNLFPRRKPFMFNEGGYCTLSFLPTLGTMLLGLIAGSVLRSERASGAKVRWFVVAGVVGLLSGAALGWLSVCPVVKRIWTPSWVLFSGGWCFLFLAAFYYLLDTQTTRAASSAAQGSQSLGHGPARGWAFPLQVIGMNSIAAYCMAHLFDHFISSSIKTHLGAGTLNALGAPYATLVNGSLVLIVLWLLLFWMHRRKIFLRI